MHPASSLRRPPKRKGNAPRRRLQGLIGALLWSTLGLMACDRAPEHASRAAVGQLVEANAFSEKEALARVAGLGSFALPDIEQALHGASTQGRLRLLEAIRRIGDPAADPLVRLLARRDEEAAVRRKASAVLRVLSGR